jgi:multicomponent Na+:H+ antiporter subunit E
MNQDRDRSGADNLQVWPKPVSYQHPASQGIWPGILRRGLLFAFVWWILVGGEIASWWIGMPAVLLAAAASFALLSPVTVVWYELFRFVPFFLIRSLLGGVDVAWRALHPSMPITPHLVEYPIQLPSGLPCVFMANTVSLLPGTLSAELGSECLKVHVLNGRKDVLSELETLEQRVAALFGTSLPARSRGAS